MPTISHAKAARSQRWRERRMSLVGNAVVFDPVIHSVDVINCPGIAKPFVQRHHYSGSLPPTRISTGLFRNSTGRAKRSELVGVASFTVSMNPAAGKRNTGLEGAASIELGRLVLLDHIEANAESWFVAKSFKLLRREKPEIEAVYAYSDPVIRTDQDGHVVLPGHVGELYQALNALSMGRGRARNLLMMPNGRVFSERAISKIIANDCGHEYAARKLIEAGASPRASGEEPRSWIERLKAERFLAAQRHPGNWIYSFPLTRAARKIAHDLPSVRPPRRDPSITEGDVTALELFPALAA